MQWPRQLWMRLQALFHRDRFAQKLNDEIRLHLDEQMEENIAAGMSPDTPPSAFSATPHWSRKKHVRRGDGRGWKKSHKICATACACCANRRGSLRLRY